MSNPSLPSSPQRAVRSPSPPGFTATWLAGASALAAAVGIGRFAFTPLLPLMLREGHLDVAAGGWLAAANYLGYLLGALTAARIRLSPQRLGLLSLSIIVVSTAAMGCGGALPLLLLLRAVAGLASAWVLVSTGVWGLGWLAHHGHRPAGAGLLFAGVGAGIAFAGLYCWQAGLNRVPADALWRQLGLLALLMTLPVALCMPRTSAPAPAMLAHAPAPVSRGTVAVGGVGWGLVCSYGALGFGYILPATFLPMLARTVTDNPAVFGAAWPVFGIAAALSTWASSALLQHVPRTRLLAGCHGLMAQGCLLPLLHLSAISVVAAALLVGSTFMVATMAGMQEAGARGAAHPAMALGRMTAAFAIGQMAGPLLASAFAGYPGLGGLLMAMGTGIVFLVVSAVWLWREPILTARH